MKTNLSSIIFLFCLVFSLSSCDRSELGVLEVPLDEEIKLIEGDIVRIEGTDIQIEFLFAAQVSLEDGDNASNAAFKLSGGEFETRIILDDSMESESKVYDDYEFTFISANFRWNTSRIKITKVG